MKLLAIFLLFAVVSQFTYAENEHQFQRDVVQKHIERIFGDKIISGLESFKQTMKTGDEEQGIPKLDPFDLAHQEIEFHEELITVDGKVGNCHIEGLSEYTVQYANYEFFGSTIVIDMVWSNIKGYTSYDLNATVLNKYPIYGAGDVSFDLQNFKFASNIKVDVDLINKKATIVSLSNTKIGLEKVKVDVTGLFNNVELSQEMSTVISDMTPQIVEDFQDEITSQLNVLMVAVGNEVLEKVDIWKFINI